MKDEQVNPTRMELIGLKNRSALAQKGHQLLKQKRDVLILELMSILKTSSDMRSGLRSRMASSYRCLQSAQSYHGITEIECMAMSTQPMDKTKVDIKNVMGVKLPLIAYSPKKRHIPERGYGIPYSSARVDEAAESFEKALDLIMEMAEKEVSMMRLLSEIERTKRRVNALESVVIPWLEESQKSVAVKLDELERADLTTLKEIKRQLEASGNLSRA